MSGEFRKKRTMFKRKQNIEEEEDIPDEDFKDQLKNMSFEEMEQLKNNVGLAAFKTALLGLEPPTKKNRPRDYFHQESEDAPLEFSSKKRVFISESALAIKTTKKQRIDPRFDSRTGELNMEEVQKEYAFVEDIRKREIKEMKEMLKSEEGSQMKAKIKSLLQRDINRKDAMQKNEVKKKIDEKYREYIREQRAQGKNPFYLKGHVKHKLELATWFKDLKEKGKLEKFMDRKRQKNIKKDKKKFQVKGPVQTIIEEKLTKALKPVHVEVLNDTHMHAEGLGPETHFRVFIVSPKFTDLTLVKRHALVYDALKEEMKSPIHALSIQALTVEQWDKIQKPQKPPPCMGGSKKRSS